MAYGSNAMKGKKKSAQKAFQPCSRCPQPSKCRAAGACIAKSFG